MSGDDDLVVKADFADGFCLIRAAGHDDAVLAVRHQRMVIIHGVDLAETGKIAVFDIDARDVVLALRLRLGAVLFQIMDRVDGNAQAGGLAHDDLGAGPVEPQHIAVDDLAGDDKAGQSGRCCRHGW